MSRHHPSGEASRTPTPGARRTLALTGTATLLALGLIGPLPAASGDTPAGATVRGPASKADLDVLYVGAHPDDEASRLSMFGEWKERFGARTGVVTVTRGEGGGNAIGPEEGPALGLIREREERKAVGTLGVTDVYNLDKVDFYYSVSAPLHQEAWNARETLGRLVRVVRQTRPEIVMTMNPAPSPGNHGGHQEAALLAIEAYEAAADPKRYPHQITREGLQPWAAKKLLTTAVTGTAGSAGPNCPTSYTPAEPTEDIYGVWSGRESRSGKSFAQLEREAQRNYASQGWAGFPDVSSDPKAIGCDYMRQIDSRVPFVRGDLTADGAASSTILEGAVLPSTGGLPLGTGLDVSTDTFRVVPGGSTTVDVVLTAPAGTDLRRTRVALDLPAGWSGSPVAKVGRIAAGKSVTRSFTVDVPTGTDVDRYLVGIDVDSREGTGFGDQQLEVVPVVEGRQEALPQVSQFDAWTERVGVEQLQGIVKPVLTLPSGGTRTVGVDVTNRGDTPASGEVDLDLPAGFSSAGPQAFTGLAPGDTERVDVEVTNDDASLPTANQGGTNGDYNYTVLTTSASGTAKSAAALELVPTATVGDTAAPTMDGVIEDGEYAAEIDLGRRWEGTACTDAADCSATGWITRSGDALYVAVDVTDDALGTVLAASDCKRHWRVDSLELAVDPTGTSENTSTTFKAAVLPTTTEGVACASRDADNKQGPIGTFKQVGGGGTPARASGDTAPGFEAVSTLKEPYTGYVIEAKIPFSVLPATVDPDKMGFNAFVYDSDTKDKTGQTRLGWSTFGGVQGDPYRWGRVVLEGDAPPAVATSEPRLEFPALSSLESPPSIAQAVRTHVALSGLPQTPQRVSAEIVRVALRDGAVRAVVKARGPGTAYLFAMYGDEVVGRRVVEVEPGTTKVRIPTSGNPGWRVLMAFDSDVKGSASSAAVVPLAQRSR
ncbi:sugar-binding protein [Nocardioides mesophilus]|uniref:PIG-L family deacetylase n=1 Tax=Nocardioides mesophilus TaxID=433659 RepID=A0A7G9REZ5_9ACTN|nr:sugar-binding protein [Nocardioides mesophilus]QNN54170.1 PIG-L family deacetylase [Nocardioides mesophilus]